MHPSKCTCPIELSHMAELCRHCESEYHNWLEEQHRQPRAETRSSAELAAELAEAA